MDFSEVLQALKHGRKATRAVWLEDIRGRRYVALLTPADPDWMPQLMVHGPDGVMRPFSGANWDLLAEDWDLLDEEEEFSSEMF